MLSRRIPLSQVPNRLTRAVSLRWENLVDLTVTNPTAVGLPPSAMEPVASGALASGRYDPDPLGLLPAREAVSAYYSGHGVNAAADRIVLSASSSEAYSWLFKLLCGPGEAVLVPAPSYPLLDALAALESVELVRYSLPPEDAWAVHADLVEDAMERARLSGRRVRAVVLVNPNNPTGTSVADRELARLEELALRNDLALISDEVFLDYRFTDRPDDVRVAAARANALVFSLGGLSKSAALPQMKLGWIVANGPARLLAPAVEGLAWVADSFLSVAAPVQHALPALLRQRTAVSDEVRRRVLENDMTLRRAFPPGDAVDVLPLRAGWTAVLRIPAVVPEEELAVSLVERHGVLVYPGYFFDFSHEAFLVLSLLPHPSLFESGVERLRGAIGALGR